MKTTTPRVTDPPLFLRERQDPVVYARHGAPGPVSQRLVEQFDQDGFIVLDSLFNADEVAGFRRELNRLREDEVYIHQCILRLQRYQQSRPDTLQ